MESLEPLVRYQTGILAVDGVETSSFNANIDIDRDSQSSFMMFQGQRNHNDEEIKKAQDYIEENYSDKITVDMLADKYSVGRRSFERRFKKATNNTVIEYMQRVKVEAAKRSLESSRLQGRPKEI